MSLTLLIDNDLVIKLAQMGCFKEGVKAIGRQPGEVGSIKIMLRFMGLGNEGRRLTLCKSRDEADRLQRALAALVEIEMTDEESKLAAEMTAQALNHDLDVDAGEVMLLAVALHRSLLEVATGDKRALCALPDLATFVPQLAALRGRLICLEQIFSLLTKENGLYFIGQALGKAPHADQALGYVYHVVAKGNASHFVAGLAHLVQQQVEVPAPSWLKRIAAT